MTRSEQTHAACASDAQITFSPLPSAQTMCTHLSGVPNSHHHASRVSFDGHERYGSGNCPDLCVAFSVCSRAGRVSC